MIAVSNSPYEISSMSLAHTCNIKRVLRYKSVVLMKFRLDCMCPVFSTPEQSNSFRKFKIHIATFENIIQKKYVLIILKTQMTKKLF